MTSSMPPQISRTSRAGIVPSRKGVRGRRAKKEQGPPPKWRALFVRLILRPSRSQLLAGDWAEEAVLGGLDARGHVNRPAGLVVVGVVGRERVAHVDRVTGGAGELVLVPVDVA